MKRNVILVIIIVFLVLVLLGIFLFAIYPTMKHSTCKKHLDVAEVESGEQIEAAKQNEYNTLQADSLTQFEREKAAEEFKEIMGIDPPNGVTINRYYLGDDGYSMIDLVFSSEEYDHVFQTIREAADKRLPLVFQNEDIYNRDLPNVSDYGWEERHFDWFNESTGQIHPIIEWYIDEPESNSGAITGFTALTLFKIADDEFHIILENG